MKASEACQIAKDNSREIREFNEIIKIIKELAGIGYKEYTLGDFIYVSNRNVYIQYISKPVVELLKLNDYTVTDEIISTPYIENVKSPRTGFFNKLLSISDVIQVKKNTETRKITIKWCCNE